MDCVLRRLGSKSKDDPPHIILFPEIPFHLDRFTEKVRKTVEKCGFCSIIVSEGVRQENGDFLTNSKSTDAFGHAQLGGVAPMIAELIEKKLKLKNHWATADYLRGQLATFVLKPISIKQRLWADMQLN